MGAYIRITFLVAAVLVALLWGPLATTSNHPLFVDVSSEAGIGAFRNIQGSLSKQHIIETMGGGAAFLDFDRDGNLNVLLVRGSTIEHLQTGGDVVCALFRGDGHGHFRDVTEASGITARGWDMGVAVADYDNDGWDDIYITCYGPNY